MGYYVAGLAYSISTLILNIIMKKINYQKLKEYPAGARFAGFILAILLVSAIWPIWWARNIRKELKGEDQNERV